jgi:biopolymer transport protein ExbB
MHVRSYAARRGPALPALLAAVALILFIRVYAIAQTSASSVAEAAGAGPTTVPAATETPTPEPAPVVPRLSAVELFRRAGFFIWPLTACSVLSVALIIERFIALPRRRILPPEFFPGLRQVFRDKEADRARAIAYCEQNDSPLARMIGAGIRRLPRGYAAAEKAIEDAGANEALKLRQNMRFLYSLGSVATLLGLIGTIWGMIKAFQVASIMGPGHTEQLSEGIYEAMVNTFAGLAVAIIVTVFYYYFVGRIERLIGEMNDAVNEFGREAGFDGIPDEDAPEMASSRNA